MFHKYIEIIFLAWYYMVKGGEDVISLDVLETEQRNDNSIGVDSLNTREIVNLINNEDKTVAYSVEKELLDIENAIDIMFECLKSGGRIIYVGAGTSGRLGVLDASECPPTYGVDDTVIQAIIAGGNEAILKAKEGAEDSKLLAIDDLKAKFLNKNDCVVGIAASGRTPYVISALEYANEIGAKTVSIACVKNSEIGQVAQKAIEVVVGAEVVTGSTRMKAGTAQKLVLNMISTTLMIKSGKVYKNLMVDLKATNKKLEERARRIVMQATGVSREIAINYLEKSDMSAKVAIFMILSSLDKNESIKVLNRFGGNVSRALEETGNFICMQ